MKLSDYIVEFMVRKGIHHFFGYQGTMIAHLVDSIEKHPQAWSHSSYNEQGAAFAACGYAQTKDSCACAYATSGPGAVNLLSGVANAYYDSQPVIFFTGQLNTYEYFEIKGLRQHGFQEMDIVSMAAPVTKYAVQVREPEDIVYELNKAWKIANSGRRGPVLIDLPMNIQRSEIKDPVYDMEIETDEQAGVPGDAERAAQAIEEALSRAERPVILMGQGVGYEGRRRLLRLAEKLHLPVITSVLEKSGMAYDYPLNFGCIGSAYGHRYANMIANAKSDLLLCFGISLCTRQTGTKAHEFAKNAEIIRVDIDPYNLQRKIHKDGEGVHGFCADAAAVLRILEKKCQETDKWSNWLAVCSEIREELTMVDENILECYPNRMVAGLSDFLTDCSAVAVDVGQHMVWSFQSFKNRKGQKLLFSGGHGAMGYALPAAIGAFFATGKPVACICGDGAFQMNIQELEWVKREQIPVKMIVMNNGALGLIRQQQRDYFECRFAGASEGCGFSSCSFAKVAEAYGISAVWAGNDRAVAEAKEFFASEGPRLLEIGLEHGTFAYPKTCLGEPIHNQQPYMPQDIYKKLLEL